jgi:hypothetical protein
VTTRGYFGSGFFAADYFVSDYFRERVPVPVPVPTPVPVPVGGAGPGSAIWPARRVCKPDRRKKNPTFVNLFGKKLADKDKKKKEELGNQENIQKVKGEFYNIKEKLSAFSKELKSRRDTDQLYGERDDFLIDEIAFFRREMKRMTHLLQKLAKKDRPRFTLSQLANLHENKEPEATEVIQGESVQTFTPQAATAVAKAVVESLPVQESPYVYMSQLAKDEKEDVSTRALRSLPWACGAGAIALGTWHLVPGEKKFVKFCGYLSAGVLAATAIWRWFEE